MSIKCVTSVTLGDDAGGGRTIAVTAFMARAHITARASMADMADGIATAVGIVITGVAGERLAYPRPCEMNREGCGPLRNCNQFRE